MGHSIQAIVTTRGVADAISAEFPSLPRYHSSDDVALFPVNARFIDSEVEPQPEMPYQDDEFMLLTARFRGLLAELSRSGRLAYIETDYFGGTGGQGAAVYDGGAEIMSPTWSESGVINRALALLGVTSANIGNKSRISRLISRSAAILGLPIVLFRDEFSKVGLSTFRNNDALVEAARRQQGAK